MGRHLQSAGGVVEHSRFQEDSHTYTPDEGPTFAQWIYNCNGVPANYCESIPSDGRGNLADHISSLRMHSVPELDVALEKNFPITETRSLQFRADAFNLTNTPLFGASPDTNPTSNGNWNGFGTVPLTRYNFPWVGLALAEVLVLGPPQQ